MRLQWFLPALRKADRGEPARPGLVRRMLKGLGPTWHASPLRRLIQAACLALFLWLFLYVSWPYTARPARVWPGWVPVEVDAETGKVTLGAEGQSLDPFASGMVLHVADAASQGDGYLGPFKVRDRGTGQLHLEPAAALDAAALDRLSASFGPWTLSEARPGSWPSHYADDLEAKSTLPPEGFLAVDPLVSISTALAAKAWVWSLAAAGGILLVCLVIPRAFCGYVCPLGTLIDLFDWVVGKRVRLFRLETRGWWVQTKYYLLVAVLAASLLGVLASGFVAAIPVLTRGIAFLLSPLQMGITRGWHQVPAIGVGHVVSIGLFLAIFGLSFMRPRFWCRYVCPTGALFSAGSLLSVSRREVQSSCIDCGRCAEICPFDAVRPDFTTRAADCAFCQTCGGACPKGSIAFVGRWGRDDLKPADGPPEGTPPTGRRGFLATAAGVAAGAVAGAGFAAAARAFGADMKNPAERPIVRPPGSVPERQFLQLCVRCGECFQACPNNVLQPLGFAQGLEGLWTPRVTPDWSGCEPSCSNCGRVCPTGAIRALSLEEKRAARMGLAVVNHQTCLPYAGSEDCQLCIDECQRAGYEAIEFLRVGTEMDPFGQPVEGTGFLAPVVLPQKCVGCGLCQTRCRAVNVKQKGLLRESAIRVEAGQGKEDRLTRGSYVALRQQERQKHQQKQQEQAEQEAGREGYLPDFLEDPK